MTNIHTADMTELEAYLTTFFCEKFDLGELDEMNVFDSIILDEPITLANLVGEIVENASLEDVRKVANVCFKIDFNNGDVAHFVQNALVPGAINAGWFAHYGLVSI